MSSLHPIVVAVVNSAIERPNSATVVSRPRLLPLQLLLLLLLLLFPCLISPVVAGTNNNNKAALDNIIVACKNGLEFESINDFRTFIAHYKPFTEEQLHQNGVPSKCIKQRAAILELEPLVSVDRVCDPIQIDSLIGYHNKYLISNRLKVFSAKPITRDFFSKYAIQVAYTCKKNLIKNLEESRELLRDQAKSLEEAKEKVFKEHPELRSNIKLIEDQPDTPDTSNAKERSETEMTLGEYREALTRLKRPEDVLTFERNECEQSTSRRIEMAATEVKMFFKPALICLNLAQYYSGSVLSIARLANHGYIACDHELDAKLADSALVKDWIVAVQVCEPMLYMRTEKIENEVAIIDTCADRITPPESLIVFGDKLEDFNGEKLREWLRTSEASRHNNQKIMKATMKKIAKANLVKQLTRNNLKSTKMIKLGFKIMRNTNALQMDMLTTTRQISDQLSKSSVVTEALVENTKLDEKSEQESFEALVGALGNNLEKDCTQRSDDDGLDKAVSFDPVTSLISTLTLFAIMMTFEWLLFVVMTLAARICYRLKFSFDDLLVFPPRVLSWRDAKFAQMTNTLEEMDEDDFFDYDELTPEEQKQRDLLMKVFGRPPPMMFRE